MPDAPSNSGEGDVALQCPSSPDSFLWRQLGSARLRAIAEKIAAGRDLSLDDAISLSRISLPLLGKLVELRPLGGDTVECPPTGAFPIERVSGQPESRSGTGQALADWESFCQSLIDVRSGTSPGDGSSCWYPSLNQRLDCNPLDCENTGNDFTGVDVLRAIALARLVLPARFEVQAPLASLGPKLAQVALDFGASHLGYVALDGETPSDPLVADPSLLDELLGSSLPTSLTEEPQKGER
jgi:hypothetical protein